MQAASNPRPLGARIAARLQWLVWPLAFLDALAAVAGQPLQPARPRRLQAPPRP